MSISFLLNSPDWDFPFFKGLSPNDAGDTRSHQAGFVIPMLLREWFPGLHGTPTAANPTISAEISATLYEGATYLGRATTTYRYQTWGGTRSPESRLTGGLALLKALARGGDFVVFQRRIDDISRFRLILVRDGTPDHTEITALVVNPMEAWGALYPEPERQPLANTIFRAATAEQNTREAAAFQLFDMTAIRTETRHNRPARSTAFKTAIRALYGSDCCVCGFAVVHPNGRKSEMEAAHVVPRSRQGSDDSRNGLGLCRRHHWAFDQGLFGVDDHSEIIAPASVLAIPVNDALLTPLVGQRIWQPPATPVAPEALRWHRDHVLLDS